MKRCNNFFAIRIANNICPRNNIFNFFYHKNFARSIWHVTFCKNVVVFQYFYMITNFKFKIFFIILFIKVNVSARLYINIYSFILIVLRYLWLYLLTISSNLSIYILLHIEVIYLQILFFRVLINLSATTDCPSLCVDYISTSFFFYHDFIESSKMFRKSLVILIPFLSSKEQPMHFYCKYQ